MLCYGPGFFAFTTRKGLRKRIAHGAVLFGSCFLIGDAMTWPSRSTPSRSEICWGAPSPGATQHARSAVRTSRVDPGAVETRGPQLDPLGEEGEALLFRLPRTLQERGLRSAAI
jgi:hypothetical protein